MNNYSQPSVDFLRFKAHSNDAKVISTTSSSELPLELVFLCLTNYADWGDLAKLACVQRSWSNIVNDTARQSISSQWELATALLNGDCGLPKSPERAVRILKQIVPLAIDPKTGKPFITQDDTTEVHTPVKPKNKYHTFSMKTIAECYLKGTGVNQDANIAIVWMKAAFLIGDDSDSAYKLAVMYEYGHHGVEVDVVAAAEWFELAAKNGHVESMVELGLCYELGCGIGQSDEHALYWYTKAAHLGHVTAKFSVGEIFEEARGVPQSDEEACIWYYRAALVGCDDSKLALRRLYDIARIVVPGVAAILND